MTRVVTLLLFLSMLASCISIEQPRGYQTEEPIESKIKVGISKDEVQSALGSPSSQSNFGDEAWYYVSARKETVAFFAPKIVEQKVTRVLFDSGGTVKAIETYGLNDVKDVSIASRSTPTEGHKLGFVEQLVGNLGRFNKEGDKSKSPAGPRRSRGPTPY